MHYNIGRIKGKGETRKKKGERGKEKGDKGKGKGERRTAFLEGKPKNKSSN